MAVCLILFRVPFSMVKYISLEISRSVAGSEMVLYEKCNNFQKVLMKQ